MGVCMGVYGCVCGCVGVYVCMCVGRQTHARKVVINGGYW